MKANIILMAGATSVILFSGCATNTAPEPKTPYAKQQNMVDIVNSLPDWVKNPEVKNGIASIGIAGYSKYGIEIMLPEAEMDARAKLAGKIKTEIYKLEEGAKRYIKVNNIEDFDRIFKQATREIVNQIPLSGAKRINLFQAKNGTLYVHMMVEKREVSQYFSDKEDIYEKYLQQANLSKKSKAEAMKFFDKIMKKLYNQDEVK